MLWSAARNCLLAAVAIASFLPQPWKGRLATFGPLHDLAHIAAFFLLAVFTLKVSWSTRKSLVAGGLLFVFGVTLETMQTRVYHNRLEVFDMLDDLTGIALASLLMAIFKTERAAG